MNCKGFDTKYGIGTNYIKLDNCLVLQCNKFITTLSTFIYRVSQINRNFVFDGP